MRLPTVIGCLLYIIILSILDVRCGIADGASTSQPAVIGFINISSQNKGVNAVIDLLSTNLSKNPMIQLVEREQLDIALKELELATTGLEDRKNLLKLGQLIRADGLGLFSLSEDGKILRVRLVDTRYGFRLLDTRFEWNEKNLEGIVEEIVSRLVKVTPKLIIPPEKEVLVGILSIRNIDPSSTLNWLELTLPKLISSKLSSEPGIIVLEREDLNLVLEEKLFTRGQDSNFLGSMVLLEGEVRQASAKEEDSHRFILTLQIRQANGGRKERLEVEGDAEKLVLLTEESTKWMVREITKTTVQGVWDTKAEAEEFFKEAKVLMAHEDWLAAKPLLETAHALEPEDDEIVKSLFLMIRGIEGKVSPLEQAQLVRRYVNIVNASFQQRIKEGDILFYLAYVWEYLNDGSSVKTDEIRDFNKRNRQICADLSERGHHALDPKIKFTGSYFPWVRAPFNWASAVSETPEEAMKRIRDVMPGILLRPGKDNILTSAADWKEMEWLGNLRRCLFVYDQYHIMSDGHLDKRKVFDLWIDFLEETSKTNDPVIKLMAELGLAETFFRISERNIGADSRVEFHCKNAAEMLHKGLSYQGKALTSRGQKFICSLVNRVWMDTLGTKWTKETQGFLPELRVSSIFNIKDYLPNLNPEAFMRFDYSYKPAIEGNTFWMPIGMVLRIPDPTNVICLAGIDLKDKSLHTFWWLDLPAPVNYNLGLQNSRPVIGKDVIYLGVSSLGIIKFPGDTRKGIGHLGNVEVITKKDGLPSNDISGVARVGERLYVALSSVLFGYESGLGVYDLRKKQWRTIISSRSKDMPHPLDKIEPPYKIFSLTPTPDGKKLFFIIREYPVILESSGLWKMDAESEKFEYIWKSEGLYDIFLEKNIWWLRGGNFLISFDPISETGEMIYSEGSNSLIMPGTAGRRSPSRENMCVPESTDISLYGYAGGLFKNIYWGMTGAGDRTPYCFFIDQLHPKVQKFSNTFDGDEITWLCPTQYGVVVIGKNKIGIIEENPEP